MKFVKKKTIDQNFDIDFSFSTVLYQKQKKKGRKIWGKNGKKLKKGRILTFTWAKQRRKQHREEKRATTISSVRKRRRRQKGEQHKSKDDNNLFNTDAEVKKEKNDKDDGTFNNDNDDNNNIKKSSRLSERRNLCVSKGIAAADFAG